MHISQSPQPLSWITTAPVLFFLPCLQTISCIQLKKRKLLVENFTTFLLRVLSSSLKASSCFKWHKKANISIGYQNHYKRKIFSAKKIIQLLSYYLFLILINIWIESWNQSIKVWVIPERTAARTVSAACWAFIIAEKDFEERKQLKNFVDLIS